jgi:hypothetical protein
MDLDGDVNIEHIKYKYIRGGSEVIVYRYLTGIPDVLPHP